jgi:hypothetical protein
VPAWNNGVRCSHSGPGRWSIADGSLSLFTASTFPFLSQAYISAITAWGMRVWSCITPNDWWPILIFILTSIYSMQIVSAPWTGLATRDKSRATQMTWGMEWDRCACFRTPPPFDHSSRPMQEHSWSMCLGAYTVPDTLSMRRWRWT